MTHTTWHIDDFGLSTQHLAAKYDPDSDGGSHPGYLQWEWRHQVSRQDTLLGYWAWVKHELEKEEDELQADSPYG